MKNIFFSLLLVFVLIGCLFESDKPIRIVTNSWIGYAPLFYANEKGYLKDMNVKLITTVSLGEASEVFSVGKADMVTTTQHEYYLLKEVFKTLVPVILIDRSYGGDMILSNKTLEEIKANKKKIYVYLEIDSINSELINMFLKQHSIDKSRIVYIDGDQAELQDTKNEADKNQIIVTYTPYDLTFLKRGFKPLATTKNIKNLIVIDSICTTKEFLDKNLVKIKALNDVINRSIEEIKKNPKEVYELTKSYLNNISYKDFLNSLDGIKWINHPTEELLDRLKTIDYKRKYLVQ